MLYFLIIAFLLLFLISQLFRCIIFNLHNVCIYSVKDTINYFKGKKWNDFNLFGIDMFIGMFGKGKTLSLVNTCNNIYSRFGDSVVFISNIHLSKIPYVKLENFQQLVDIGENPPEGVKGFVIVIDEISSVLSHRNYANFPLDLLPVLMQQRKLKMKCLCTSQRYFMVDKIWRSITTNVIDCNKIWRFQHNVMYDAWDYENAMNDKLIKKIGSRWFFVKDSLYNSYDTSQMLTKHAAEDFISNDEALKRKGLDNIVNMQAVKNPKKLKTG